MLGRGVVGRETSSRGRGGLRGNGVRRALRRARGRGAKSRDTFKAGEAGDAIGALSLEAGGGGVVLVAAAERAGREVAAMAVLDCGRGESGERGGGASGGARHLRRSVWPGRGRREVDEGRLRRLRHDVVGKTVQSSVKETDSALVYEGRESCEVSSQVVSVRTLGLDMRNDDKSIVGAG